MYTLSIGEPTQRYHCVCVCVSVCLPACLPACDQNCNIYLNMYFESVLTSLHKILKETKLAVIFSRRKRGERESSSVETPGDIIIRKLTIERIEELKRIVQEEEQRYK